MARYYSKINKQDFIDKIEKLFSGKYHFSSTTIINKDLEKVEFSWENITLFDDTTGFAKYPAGYYEMDKDFHVFFMNAGGDWEYPVCFLLYWSGKELRGYIPVDGNVYDKKNKIAYGNEEWETEEEEDAAENIDHDSEYDFGLMKKDILNRILLK